MIEKISNLPISNNPKNEIQNNGILRLAIIVDAFGTKRVKQNFYLGYNGVVHIVGNTGAEHYSYGRKHPERYKFRQDIIAQCIPTGMYTRNGFEILTVPSHLISVINQFINDLKDTSPLSMLSFLAGSNTSGSVSDPSKNQLLVDLGHGKYYNIIHLLQTTKKPKKNNVVTSSEEISFEKFLQTLQLEEWFRYYNSDNPDVRFMQESIKNGVFEVPDTL